MGSPIKSQSFLFILKAFVLGTLLAPVTLSSGCVGQASSRDDVDAGGDGGGNGGETAPSVTVEQGATVISGMTVPLFALISGADTVSWSQLSGPAATLIDSTEAHAYAETAIDLAAAEELVFEVTATNTAGITKAEVTYVMGAPVFDDFLGGIGNVAELGTSEGIDFNDQGLWVVSVNDTNGGPGFVSRFDSAAAFVERLEVPNAPIGANFNKDGLLVVTRSGLNNVETLNTADGTLTPIITNAGATNYPLPDKDGNVFVSNRANGQVIRYDADQQTQAVFTDNTTGTNPNAIAFGPENDILYVGAVDTVYRVPINADGTAGTPEVYVTVTGEVDGLAFDSGRNLWIGSPGAQTLYMVPYVAGGPSVVRLTYSPADPAPNRFVSLTFGTGGFGVTSLYWTSLERRTVGRLDIGLPSVVPPLSVDAATP